MHGLRGWQSYRPVVQPETRAPARGQTWKEAGVLSSCIHRLLQLCGSNSRVEFSRATLINCGQSLILCCLPSPSAKVKWVPSPSLSGAQSSGILEILGLGCQHPPQGASKVARLVCMLDSERGEGRNPFLFHSFTSSGGHCLISGQLSNEENTKGNITPNLPVYYLASEKMIFGSASIFLIFLLIQDNLRTSPWKPVGIVFDAHGV